MRSDDVMLVVKYGTIRKLLWHKEWCSIAIGLHLPSLKNYTSQHQLKSYMVQPLNLGEIVNFKLNPRWKVSHRAFPITSRFVPPIQNLTIFKKASHQPLVVFRAIPFPSDEELIATAMRA